MQSYDLFDEIDLKEAEQASIAIDELWKTLNVDKDVLVPVINALISSLPYLDMCSRCQVDPFEHQSRATIPYKIEVQEDQESLTAWYRCRRCRKKWTCSWGLNESRRFG